MIEKYVHIAVSKIVRDRINALKGDMTYNEFFLISMYDVSSKHAFKNSDFIEYCNETYYD